MIKLITIIIFFILLPEKVSDMLVRKKRVIDQRPHGKEPVPIEQVPYMANVERNGINICGGVIVAAYIIITAAHCVTGYPGATYTVRTGSAHVNLGQLHHVRGIILHSEYHDSEYENDIALLIIDPLVKFKPNISESIPLATQHVPPGTLATISGWGCTEVIW